MARVLCISSQTVFGPVGNSAAVPALQELGHEVLALPTVVLSNHPGLGKPVGQQTDLDAMFATLNGIGALRGIDAVLTGYFSSAAQVIAAAKQIETLAKQNQVLQVLVDPVIGDNGALYVPEDVAKAIRHELLPLATIVTPNLFELQWLTGVADVSEAVSCLATREIMVTSIPDGTRLITKLFSADLVQQHTAERRANVPHGTGDFLAGCYLGARLQASPDVAFNLAMKQLDQVIAQSLGMPGLQLSVRRAPVA